MKDFQYSTGLLLDADFATHRQLCPRCAGYSADQPATLAACCLEGVILIKREAPHKKRISRERNEHRTTKAVLAATMRYK
jgi:hypothetical protein